MTWTKLGAEFSDECAEANLSDAAFRTHVEAIQYLYGIESADMRIQKHLMRRWAGSRDYLAGAAELAGIGWWSDAGDAYIVGHHAAVVRQSLAAQQTKRDRDRDHKRAVRKGKSPTVASAVASDNVSDGATAQTDRQTDRHLGSEHLRTSDDDGREQPLTPSLDESSSRPPDDDNPEQVRATLGAAGWNLTPEWTPEDPWADAPVRRPPDARRDDDAATVHYLPPAEIAPANPGGTGWDFPPDSY